MQLATVTCPNQALTNCGHYTKVQYRDSEPNNTPENMYIAMHGSARLLLPLKRICGYPHISNCYHGELSPYLLNAPVVTLSLAVLLIFIELEPAEDFRVFTQSCPIINTPRFPGLSSRICYRTGTQR